MFAVVLGVAAAGTPKTIEVPKDPGFILVKNVMFVINYPEAIQL